MKKKMLPLFLALCMAFDVLSAGALAAGEVRYGPDGQGYGFTIDRSEVDLGQITFTEGQEREEKEAFTLTITNTGTATIVQNKTETLYLMGGANFSIIDEDYEIAPGESQEVTYGYRIRGSARPGRFNDMIFFDFHGGDPVIVRVTGELVSLGGGSGEETPDPSETPEVPGRTEPVPTPTPVPIPTPSPKPTGGGGQPSGSGGTIEGNGQSPAGAPEQKPLPTSDWAREALNGAVAEGLVDEADVAGKLSVREGLDSSITRQEFCHLARLCYEKLQGAVPEESYEAVRFADCENEEVRKMASLDVVRGVGGGRFEPDGLLTREQAATMLSRLALALQRPFDPAEPDYADGAYISAWAWEAVGQMQKSGVMNGTGGDAFTPQGRYSWEQSVVTLYRLYGTMK